MINIKSFPVFLILQQFYLSRSHLTVLGASEYSNILITAMTGMRPFEQTT